MSRRRADTTLLTRVTTLKSDAVQLRLDLRNYGDLELADAIDRVVRELSTGAVNGILNTVGVDHSDVRR